MDKSSLGDRMKSHENASRHTLTRRVPVILRVDGKAFHSFVRKAKFDSPFSARMASCMNFVTYALMTEIQGAQFAYAQSDEVSVLITDYENPGTQPWFGYVTQKMASVAASLASNAFNERLSVCGLSLFAAFDARVFNIAHEEVINYFIWRQQDAQRNSVQMYARSMFSHNQCTGKSCEELKSMMWTEHGKAWGELDARWRNGFCVTKNEDGLHANIEIPTFVNDREFVTQFV